MPKLYVFKNQQKRLHIQNTGPDPSQPARATLGQLASTLQMRGVSVGPGADIRVAAAVMVSLEREHIN